MDARKIGKFIRKRRKELGLSIETFSAELGVYSLHVKSWEKGETIPETNYLLTIANVLQCSVEDLLNGLDKENKNEIAKVGENQTSQNYYQERHRKSFFYHDAVDKNGFIDIERTIMYVFCVVILIILISTNVYRIYRSFSPYALTVENAHNYLEINANYDMNRKEIVLEVKNKDDYDIKDFSIEITIKIRNIEFFPGAQVDDTRKMSIRIDNFPSNEKITKKLQVSYGSDLLNVYKTEINAVSGRL